MPRGVTWTFPPRGSHSGVAAVLFVEAASETAAVVFLLDTTRGAVVGRAAPRCWHVVKKHAQRLVCAPASFIVSADTPRSAQPPRGFSLFLACWGYGVRVGRDPAPRFSRSGPEAAGAAGPPRLCLKVPLLGSPRPRRPPTPSRALALFFRDVVFLRSKECDSGPPHRPRV